MSRPRYTMADVRASFTPERAWSEMQGELPSYLVYRRLSFYPAWLALRLGVSPNAITVISIGLIALMLWQSIRGGADAYLWVVGCGFSFHVLDCADGTVARTAGSGSVFGAVFDGLVDWTFWVSLFVSVGFLVEHQGGGALGPWGLELALLLGVVVLLNRQTRDNFALLSDSRTYFRGTKPDTLSLGDCFLIAVVGLEGTYVYAIALGGWTGHMDRVLIGMAVYVFAIFAGAMVMTLQAARGKDRETKS